VARWAAAVVRAAAEVAVAVAHTRK
jgi:hypothetical protein